MKVLAAVVLGSALLTTLLAFQRSRQYEYEMQNPRSILRTPTRRPSTPSPASATGPDDGGRRRGGSWGTDSNKAERQFVQGVRRLTRIHTRSIEEIIDVDSDEVYNWPWLYAVEVGHWDLSDAAGQTSPRLSRPRAASSWSTISTARTNGKSSWRVSEVFPDRPIVDIENDNPSFTSSTIWMSVSRSPAASSSTPARTYERDGVEPKWRAVFDDKGRIQVAICHNMDLGDAWEWADSPDYPEKYASLAYRIGINYSSTR